MATAEQRRKALEWANQVRALRAQERRRMTLARAQGILAQPPDWALGWGAAELVRGLPGFGQARARRALMRARVVDGTLIGTLVADQRAALARALEQLAPASTRARV